MSVRQHPYFATKDGRIMIRDEDGAAYYIADCNEPDGVLEDAIGRAKHLAACANFFEERKGPLRKK